MRSHPGTRPPFWFGVVSAAMLMAAPSNAESCSCILSPCQGLASSDAVFEATVEAIETGPPDEFGARERVRLKDLKPHRGKAQSTVFTDASSCGYDFEVGVRYLIVADSAKGGDLSVSMCGLTTRIEAARGLIDYAKALEESPIRTRVWGEVFKPTGPYRAATSPVRDAIITLHGPREMMTRTDAQGRFLFTGLPPGSYSATARVPGLNALLEPVLGDFELEPDVAHACAEVMFEVPATGQVTGVVLNERGDPMAGGFVQLHAVNASGTGEPVNTWLGTETDAVGRYYFLEIPPGTYQVAVGSVDGQLLARSTSGSTTFAVNDGDQVSLEPLQWRTPEKLATEVTVRDADGAPAAGVEVQPLILINGDEPFLGGPAVASDADGKLVVTLLRDQRYRLIVGSHRSPRAESKLVADGQPVTLVLRR